MLTFTGTKASAGVTIGPVVRINHGSVGLHRIVCDPFRERALFEAAVVLAKDELRSLQQRAQGPDADILIFQIALLDDESFTTEIGDYIAAGAGGAAAVERAEQIFAGRLNNVDNAYIRERSIDVSDACRRVVDILDGRPRADLHLVEPCILAADRFFPTDLLSVDRKMVLGLASDGDSTTSHAAIMARSMGLPAVVALGGGVADLADGCLAVLDANAGTLVIEPEAEQLAQANHQMALQARVDMQRDPLADQPSRTADGVRFHLLSSANVSGPDGIEYAMHAGAEGIAPLRTESLILAGYGEEEQYYHYLNALAAAGGKAVMLRSCDPGADDGAEWTRSVQDALAENGHVVPTQIRAALRAANGRNLQIVLPMIAGPEDWKASVGEIEACRQELRQRGVPFREDLPLGCIIDMPAAALMAGEILDAGARFLLIDIDDLTRFTCVTTRAEAGANYRLDTPAVVRLVQFVLREAAVRQARVLVCGITEFDLDAMVSYLRIGVRSFCVERTGLLPLKAKLMAVTA